MRNLGPIALALLLTFESSGIALARGGGGGARGGGGGGGMQTRQAAPQNRSQNVSRPSGGFKLNNDLPQSRPPQTAQRPAARPPGNGNNGNINRPGNGNGSINRPPGNGNGNGNINRPGNGNGNINRPPGNGNGNGNINRPGNGNGGNYNRPGYVRPPPPPNNWGNRTVVVNPIYRGPAWGWNGGVAWYPAPTYWGGGFWGALAITATAAAVYGTVVSNNQSYTSYQVQPSSPGSTLLSNYQLQQVPCGPPGIVVIYGPDDSVICANPNAKVAAGAYDLDTQQLSLVSR